MKAKFGYIIALAGVLCLAVSGCNKPDPTMEAAPPPGPNARPEPGGGQPKNMPSNNGPVNMSGPGAPASKP